VNAHNHPTPTEVRQFMRLAERLQANPGAKLTRAESALVRRMLRIARERYENATDLTIKIEPPRA